MNLKEYLQTENKCTGLLSSNASHKIGITNLLVSLIRFLPLMKNSRVQYYEMSMNIANAEK